MAAKASRLTPEPSHIGRSRSNSSMRVGFDARWYNNSGVGTYVAELLLAMAVTPRDFELVVYEDPRNMVPELDGLPVTRIPVHSRRYTFEEQWEFRRRAREDRLDILHSPFYAAPLLLRCPLVVTIHDLIPLLFPMHGSLKQQLIRFGHAAASRRAQHIIAVSQTTAADITRLLRIPSGRVTPVPLAARSCFQPQGETGELERLCSKYGVRVPYVVLPSARNWRTKNLEGAVRALQIAHNLSGTAFQTVVYGHREGFDAVPRAATLGLDVQITGYLDQAEMAALLRHAHAFVAASLYEGFGLPLVEAMACGCAVVSSNAGSLSEVAGKGAQVFAPCDIAGMGAAVTRLLLAPEDRNRWKEAALERASVFSWKQTARETIGVYHEVLKERAARNGASVRAAHET